MKEKILHIIRRIFFPLELAAIILVSLKFFLEEENTLITSAGFLLLAILYFLSAYFPPALGMSGFASFSKRMLGISLSISVIGIYFTFMHLPGARALLTIGVITVIVALVFLLIEILRKSETANLVKFAVIRGLVIAIFGALLLYFTDFTV